jgi:caffeoyl-CoA O-methyltransferase
MDFLPDNLIDYCVKNSTTEPEILKQLRRETFLKIPQPRMLSGAMQGVFLTLISKLTCPLNILEIGTYTGYSAICLAQGLQKEGTLVTLEKNDELAWLSNKYFEKSGLNNKIKPLLGNAIEIIPTLNKKFDLIFIDADKQNYLEYYKLCKPILNKNGLLLADNTLWSGKVLEKADEKDIDTKVLQTFNETLANDKDFYSVLLPLRDGIMMSKKLC